MSACKFFMDSAVRVAIDSCSSCVSSYWAQVFFSNYLIAFLVYYRSRWCLLDKRYVFLGSFSSNQSQLDAWDPHIRTPCTCFEWYQLGIARQRQDLVLQAAFCGGFFLFFLDKGHHVALRCTHCPMELNSVFMLTWIDEIKIRFYCWKNVKPSVIAFIATTTNRHHSPPPSPYTSPIQWNAWLGSLFIVVTVTYFLISASHTTL